MKFAVMSGKFEVISIPEPAPSIMNALWRGVCLSNSVLGPEPPHNCNIINTITIYKYTINLVSEILTTVHIS